MPPDASIRSPLILGSAVQSHRRPSIPVQQICCTIRRGGSGVTQAGDDTPGPGLAARAAVGGSGHAQARRRSHRPAAGRRSPSGPSAGGPGLRVPAAQPQGTAPGLQRHHRGADLVYLRPGPQRGAAGRGGQVRPVGTVVPARDPGSRGGLRGVPEGKGTAMSEEPEFFSYTREEFLDEFVHPDDRPAVEEARQRRALQVRAEYLTEMRKKAGLTQAEVAEAMGVSQQRVSAIESGAVAELATLGDYIRALGGELKVIADFGDSWRRVA